MRNGQSTSALTRALAAAQTRDMPGAHVPAVFRLYTEDLPVVRMLDAAGFNGASLHHVTGVWNGHVEAGLVIEIVGELSDCARIVRLAADIARQHQQTEVLVTWTSSKGFDVAHVYGK